MAARTQAAVATNDSCRSFRSCVELLQPGRAVDARHSDPGCTLRVYTHLLPNSDEPARTAVDRALAGPADAPETPQEAL